MTDRRSFCRRLAVLLGAGWAGLRPARAAGWPEHPIRLVVPFSAGSIVDRLGRALGERMAGPLGQPVVIENQPGAGGTIAVDRVARAEPDGYTLVLAGDGAITNPTGAPERAGFDALRELTPISQIAITPNVLVVPPSLAAHSVGELMALAKSKPGGLSYASSGIGTSQHRAGEAFARFAGVDLTHVPYGQSQAMLGDLIAGRVDLLFGNAASVLPMVRDGRLRALAVTSRTRLPDAAELPTMDESGCPGFEAVAWFGLFVPAHTPADIVARLEKEAMSAVAAPELRRPFAGNGVLWVGGSSAAFTERIHADLRQMRPTVHAGGAR